MRLTTWYGLLVLAFLMTTPAGWPVLALLLGAFGLRHVIDGEHLTGAVLLGMSFGPAMAAFDAWAGHAFFDQLCVAVFFAGFGVALDTTLWLVFFRKPIASESRA